MSHIHTHPGQPEMQVEVILASKTNTGAPPIYTIRMRYPRIIHGEIMTHRVFSRNARSSRAVPVQTMLNEVREKPFVPWHWGKNQKGMQADEECFSSVDMSFRDDCAPYSTDRENAWLYARNCAVDTAQALMEAGYHKQIPNRLLEPFSWIDTLITSTDWSNFLWLRDHKDAEPHLQDLARLVRQAINKAEYQELEKGEWHLPYITSNDKIMNSVAGETKGHVTTYHPNLNALLKISAARCARISYKPFNGDASYESELARYDLLVKSDRVHASPLEHQAMPDEKWEQAPGWKSEELHGNLTGWIQNRKLIPNERA